MAKQLVRDGVWQSKKLRRCTWDAHIAFAYVLPIADHWGRFEWDLEAIWAKTCASRKDVTIETVTTWFQQYEREGLLVRYRDAEGRELAAWENFEGIPESKRTPSEFHAPPKTRRVPKGYPAGTGPVHIGVGEQTGVGAGEQRPATREDHELARLRGEVGRLLDEESAASKIGRDELLRTVSRTPHGKILLRLDTATSVPWLEAIQRRLIERQLTGKDSEPQKDPRRPEADERRLTPEEIRAHKAKLGISDRSPPATGPQPEARRTVLREG